MTFGTRGLAVLAALLAVGGGGVARADGVTCTGSLRDDSERSAADGAALERSGHLVEAFAHYRAAGEYCDLASAREGVSRTGKALGAAAEKAGRGYGEDRFRWEARPHCFGKATAECVSASELDAMRRASAVAWYEASGHPGETDRVMLAHARAHPDDLATFRKVWSHFEWRDRVGIETGAPKAGSPRAQLQQLASAHVAALLEKEARAFPKEPDVLAATECLRLLEDGRSWLEAAHLDAAPVRARALQRGDARLRGSGIDELGEAKRFYEFAQDEPRLKELRAKASAEGEKALAANQWMNATQYFTLADDEARAQAALPKIDPASVQKPDPEKMKGMQKTDAEKEKFRQEQADLEKELGM